MVPELPPEEAGGRGVRTLGGAESLVTVSVRTLPSSSTDWDWSSARLVASVATISVSEMDRLRRSWHQPTVRRAAPRPRSRRGRPERRRQRATRQLVTTSRGSPERPRPEAPAWRKVARRWFPTAAGDGHKLDTPSATALQVAWQQLVPVVDDVAGTLSDREKAVLADLFRIRLTKGGRVR